MTFSYQDKIGYMLRLGGGVARVVDQSGEIIEVKGEHLVYSEETASMFEQSAQKNLFYVLFDSPHLRCKSAHTKAAQVAA